MQADLTKSEGSHAGPEGSHRGSIEGPMGGSGIGHYKKLKRCVFNFSNFNNI